MDSRQSFSEGNEESEEEDEDFEPENQGEDSQMLPSNDDHSFFNRGGDNNEGGSVSGRQRVQDMEMENPDNDS
jgi:hypothetical protein